MITRTFPYDRPCCFQKFEATETILVTGTTIWKPGFRDQNIVVIDFFFLLAKKRLFEESEAIFY